MLIFILICQVWLLTHFKICYLLNLNQIVGFIYKNNSLLQFELIV